MRGGGRRRGRRRRGRRGKGRRRRVDGAGVDAVEPVLILFTLDVLLDVLVAVLLARLTVSWLPAVADGTGVTGGPPGAVSAEARPLSRNRSSDTPATSSNSSTAPRLRVCRATARIIGSVRTRREALRSKRPERDPRGCITPEGTRFAKS